MPDTFPVLKLRYSEGLGSELPVELAVDRESKGVVVLALWIFRGVRGRARGRPLERIYFLDGIELTRPIDSLILPRLSEGLWAQW